MFDITRVVYSEAVQQIHEDNNNEENKGEEEGVGEHSKIGAAVDGKVGAVAVAMGCGATRDPHHSGVRCPLLHSDKTWTLREKIYLNTELLSVLGQLKT